MGVLTREARVVVAGVIARGEDGGLDAGGPRLSAVDVPQREIDRGVIRHVFR